jgi:hypothetical protein
MGAGTWLTVVVAAAAALAIFLTMPTGRRLASRLGLSWPGAGRAPREDREYLLRVCDGSKEAVTRMLDAERARNPEMSEAEAYRKAIRTHLRARM